MQGLMDAVLGIGSGEPGSVHMNNIIFSGVTKNTAGFKGLKFTDINFFDFSNGSETSLAFRTAVAQWYYILRAISAAVLLVILIYIGIRMALSSVGQEQAKYKKMFTDWVVSVALLFLLHYIIIFIIAINKSLVNTFATLATDNSSLKTMDSQVTEGMFQVNIGSWFCVIMYLMMKGMTFSYFIYYVKRMVTVGFLIMISPLICITYSLDKIGDGKAQALNNWLREIVYNILIQPFHCIIYIAFFSAIGELVDSNELRIAPYILAFVVFQFMRKAEDILKKIFQFDTSSVGSVASTGQSIANARGQFVKIGTTVGKGGAALVGGFKAMGGVEGIKQGISNAKANLAANKSVKDTFKSGLTGAKSLKDYKNSEEGKAEFEGIKQQKLTDMKKEADKKRENKARDRYDRRNGKGAYDKMIADKTDANVKEKQDQAVASAEADKTAFDAKVEDRARSNYDAAHGQGAYDRMKQMASKDARNATGSRTAQSKAAAAIDKAKNDAREDVKNDIRNDVKNNSQIKNKARQKAVQDSYKDKDTQSTYRRTVNGVGRTYGRFTNSRTGKAVMTGLKDTTKVTTAIAMGAVAYGASGEFQDAYTAGQLGYGLANGILDNSSKTIINDSADVARKYMEVSGVKQEEIPALMNSIKFDGDTGVFKKIDDLQKNLLSEITKIVGNKDDAKRFLIDLNSNASKQGASIDLDKLIENLGITDETDKNNIRAQTQDYIDMSLRSKMYELINKGEGLNMEVDTFGEKTMEKVEKDDRLNIDVTLNSNGTTTVNASGRGAHTSQTQRNPGQQV